MPRIDFPYGKEKLSLDVPEARLSGVLTSKLESFVPGGTPEELVAAAMENPVGSPRLSELAKGKRKIVIIASDHTRPVPSRIIIPPMLREIREGNPAADITILIATGCHRGTTAGELEAKFGPDVFGKEKIVVHDCDDKKNLVCLGKLPSGGDLVINRLAAEADLLVSEGFIEPHFFAGFSGGRKSVLPGVASRTTVMYNHNGGFIAHPSARTGVLDGNPIHRDMLFAAKAAGLAYIVNVVINPEKKTVFAVAGEPESAHLRGCRFLLDYCRVKAIPSDIVITTNGGYPLDQNAYQSVKGMTAAEGSVKPGGVIIMISKCSDGHGGESFYRTFRDEKNVDKLIGRFVSTPPEETVVDQWQSQIFARVLKKSTVIFVSDMDEKTVRDLHMIPARSPAEALGIADGILLGKGISNGSVLAIPDGVSVIVE
ncbi:MAG: nickel-dependent lactate racemase [Clostridia bacterium]|nr:nickel-dependent lactate racemase [Clostridia bacterium]